MIVASLIIFSFFESVIDLVVSNLVKSICGLFCVNSVDFVKVVDFVLETVAIVNILKLEVMSDFLNPVSLTFPGVFVSGVSLLWIIFTVVNLDILVLSDFVPLFVLGVPIIVDIRDWVVVPTGVDNVLFAKR